MKNKHTTQDIPTGLESYGYSGINSYTNTQLVKVTAHLAQHGKNYGLKPLEYAPEVGPTQCKTYVASAHVCVCINICAHNILYVHFYFCVD